MHLFDELIKKNKIKLQYIKHAYVNRIIYFSSYINIPFNALATWLTLTSLQLVKVKCV